MTGVCPWRRNLAVAVYLYMRDGELRELRWHPSRGGGSASPSLPCRQPLYRSRLGSPDVSDSSRNSVV